MSWNVVKSGCNLSSTYQQVIENMRYIQDVILPKIDIFEDTIFNPEDSSGNTDIVLDEDDILRVVGISIITDKKDEDTPPSGYIRNITYELKNSQVIGLSGKSGISLNHVLVKTVAMDITDDTVDYPTWQAAYGDIDMTVYFRKATSADTWGEWVKTNDLLKALEENEEILQRIMHRQFISSLTQPEDDEQLEGDYWAQSLVPIIDEDTMYFLQSITDESHIIPIDDEVKLSFALDSLADNVDNPIPVESDDEFVLGYNTNSVN